MWWAVLLWIFIVQVHVRDSFVLLNSTSIEMLFWAFLFIELKRQFLECLHTLICCTAPPSPFDPYLGWWGQEGVTMKQEMGAADDDQQPGKQMPIHHGGGYLPLWDDPTRGTTGCCWGMCWCVYCEVNNADCCNYGLNTESALSLVIVCEKVEKLGVCYHSSLERCDLIFPVYMCVGSVLFGSQTSY